MTIEEKLRAINIKLETAAHAIAHEVGSILEASGNEPAVVKHAGETLFAYLHEHAASLEVMLLAIGVDEDVLDALVNNYRGDVAARVIDMRVSVQQRRTFH